MISGVLHHVLESICYITIPPSKVWLFSKLLQIYSPDFQSNKDIQDAWITDNVFQVFFFSGIMFPSPLHSILNWYLDCFIQSSLHEYQGLKNSIHTLYHILLENDILAIFQNFYGVRIGIHIGNKRINDNMCHDLTM